MTTDERLRRWFALRAKSHRLLDTPAPAPRADTGEPDALLRWAERMPQSEPEPPAAKVKTSFQNEVSPPVDIRAEVAAAVEAAVETEREHTIALLAELLVHVERESAKKLREERRSLADETKALRIELCELQTVVAELRATLAHERGKPLDLPSRRIN